jgi:hypothetical protein
MKLYNSFDRTNRLLRLYPKFAWKPKQLDNGDVVWLERYLTCYTNRGYWLKTIPYNRKYIGKTFEEYEKDLSKSE